MGKNAPIFVRLLLTFLVVFGTFNPTGISLWGWIAGTDYHSNFYTDPIFFGQVLVFLVLVALWVIFARITLASLRGWGILLLVLIIAAVFGFIWSLGLLSAASDAGHVKLIWIVEISVWLILFIGSSAPQIYRWMMSVFTNQPVHHDVGHHN